MRSALEPRAKSDKPAGALLFFPSLNLLGLVFSFSAKQTNWPITRGRIVTGLPTYRQSQMTRRFFCRCAQQVARNLVWELSAQSSCDKVRPRLPTKLSGNSNVHSGDGGSNAGDFLGWNPCSFNAVNACGRLVGLASNGN